MRKYFKDLKVGRKLMLSFALIIVLYVITVVTSVMNFRELSIRMEKLYNEPFTNAEASLNMIANMQGVGRSLAIMCVDTDKLAQEDYLTKTKNMIAEAETSLELLASGYTVDDEKIATLKSQFNDLKSPRDTVLDYLEEGKADEAFDAYKNIYEPKADIVRNTLNEVTELCTADAKNSMDSANSRNASVIGLMVLIAALVIVFTVVICFIITRNILEPVNAVKKAASEIANGQLALKLEYESGNEFGELADDIRSTAKALNNYVDEIRRGLRALGSGKLNYHSHVNYKGDFVAIGEAMDEISSMLKDSMQQISSSAEQVSSGAEQVSNGAQALAQGASEQASSIEELAVSINEIAESVRDNADNAVKSSELADSMGTGISKSNCQMQSLLKSIEDIRKNSREITGVVKEIEDIAFQTNILALNASVEAARAGDAGKGFSVVAGEVRRLSSKTTSASKLTAELIAKNAEAVEEGIRAVDVTAASLRESVESAEAVNTIVDKISSVSVQQADAITQIRKSVELISEIVQGNSATSEESAAASEELSAQAQILKDLVEQFEY
ncbi:methyl-accepting chemotaxis protein [Blautia schinkii]|nr:methyl-accepting chemotaxis protein [Blautia schinkii]